MNCEKCKQAPATVHVTELRPLPDEGAAASNGSAAPGKAGKADAPSASEAQQKSQPSASEAQQKTQSSASETQQESSSSASEAQKAPSSEAGKSKAASSGETAPPKSAGSSEARPAPKQPTAKPPAKSAGKSAANKAGAHEESGANGSPYALSHVHLCAGCADKLDLWHSLPVVSNKGVHSIWKLLQSAKAGHAAPELSCPSCGMTLAEFRAKGRLGCPNDYEVFRAHLNPLLKRMHNASEHVGRLPGVEAGDLERQRRIHALRAQLDAAVRDEAYEHAARLRDELQQLEPRREG